MTKSEFEKIEAYIKHIMFNGSTDVFIHMVVDVKPVLTYLKNFVVKPKKCVWKYDGAGHFTASCRLAGFEISKVERKHFRWQFKYCPYCGKEIEVKE